MVIESPTRTDSGILVLKGVLIQIIMLIATTVTNLWLAGCLLWQFMMEKDLFQCENTGLTTEEILQYLVGFL
jgi:hypothetical protein